MSDINYGPMTIEGLHKILSDILSLHPKSKDNIVCIPNNNPSIGPIAVTKIKSAHQGIDWDVKKFFLIPETKMVELKP